MRINGSGSIGIGTTDPGAFRLNVNGNTNITGSLNVIGTTTASAFIGPLTGTLNASNVSAGVFGANTGNGNYSFMGKVGIGTTAPSQKLDVAGNINLNTNGTNALFSTYNGANSDGANLFIGGGGQSSVGEVGATYKGSYNSVIGVYALYSNTTGYYNSAIGVSALRSNTTGVYNSAIGVDALYSNTTGYYNSAIGVSALRSNTTGYYNSAIGVDALRLNTTGYNNSAIGLGALRSNTTGSYNSAIGLNAGRFIADGSTGRTTGNYGLYLGSGTKASADGTDNEIVIGYNAVGLGSNTAVYGNTSMTKHIFSNGSVGIGTTDPGAYKLKVAGDVAITGTLQTQTGSDFAEEFSVAEELKPGTVVVMADKGYKSVEACSQEYDRTVVGIVSDNPSIIAGKVDSKKKAVVAMMGVVSVNVCNENGSIHKGDLLTTSNIEGLAMKADEFKFGTVIGKALEDLNGKKGSIKVLVNLQ